MREMGSQGLAERVCELLNQIVAHTQSDAPARRNDQDAEEDREHQGDLGDEWRGIDVERHIFNLLSVIRSISPVTGVHA